METNTRKLTARDGIQASIWMTGSFRVSNSMLSRYLPISSDIQSGTLVMALWVLVAIGTEWPTVMEECWREILVDVQMKFSSQLNKNPMRSSIM